MANGAELAMILRAKEDGSVKSAFDGIKEQARGLGDSIKAGFGAAIGGSLFEGVKAGFDTVVEAVSGATEGANRLQAQLGLTADEAAALGDVAQQVFRNNFGADIGEVNSTIATIQQNLGKLSPELTKQAAEASLTLQDLFEVPANESTRTVSVMMKNFQGLSQTDAFDIITKGFQEGGNFSDELLDTLREYAPQFAKMGLSADQAMGILLAGTEAGAFNLDKVGDAVKEMSLRVIDGSKGTSQAFADLGLNADQMAANFAKGGPAAEQAFQATLAALAAVEDPLKRNEIGVALLGTQWEDLGPTVVTSMAEGIKGIGDFQGATEAAAAAAYGGIGPAIETMKRQLIGLGVDAILPLMPMLTSLVTAMTTGLMQAIGVIREVGKTLSDVFSGGGTIDDLTEASLALANFLPLNVASDIVNTVNMLGGVFDAVFQGDIPMALDFAQRTLEGFGNLISTVVEEWAAAFAGWVDGASGDMLDGLGDMLIDVASWIQESSFSIIEKLAEWAAAFIDWIGPKIPDMLRELGAFLVKVTSWMADEGLPNLTANLLEWGQAFIEWIGPRIGPMLIELAKLEAELGVWIVSTALPAIAAKLVQWGLAFVEWVALHVIPALPGALATIATTVLGWVTGVLGEFLSAGANLGKSVIQGIIQGIANNVAALRAAAGQALRDAIQAGIDAIRSGSPSKETEEKWGVPMAQGLVAGLLSQRAAILGVVNGVMGEAVDAASRQAGLMLQLAERAAFEAADALARARFGPPGNFLNQFPGLGSTIGHGVSLPTYPAPSGSIIPGLNNIPGGSVAPPTYTRVDVYVGQSKIDDMWVETRERVERAGR